jgi:RNA polymerase sigma factor (TIGR02999 family)
MRSDITQLLHGVADGDARAADRLLPHVYEELRALAASFWARQRSDHTLQPTALVHEAYMRLVGSDGAQWSSRKHFFDVAAMAMRQLLVDHARRRCAEKRGGKLERVTLDDSGAAADSTMPIDIVSLDAALTRLASLDARQARIVELRFLAGLSVEDAAGVLGVSARTVKLDWQMARAWLRRELGGAN